MDRLSTIRRKIQYLGGKVRGYTGEFPADGEAAHKFVRYMEKRHPAWHTTSPTNLLETGGTNTVAVVFFSGNEPVQAQTN